MKDFRKETGPLGGGGSTSRESSWTRGRRSKDAVLNEITGTLRKPTNTKGRKESSGEKKRNWGTPGCRKALDSEEKGFQAGVKKDARCSNEA